MIEIVIIIGYKKLLVIFRFIFNEVIINVNLLIWVRLKLYCMVIFNGCFDKIMLFVLKIICLSRMVNVIIIMGYIYFIIMVGFIIIFIDIKKMVLNKFFIGVISFFIFLVFIVFVKIDFIIKVLNVVENLILVVIIIILKYNVSEIISNVLFVIYLWECFKNVGMI